MKTKSIFLFVLGILFVSIFFFKIIPIPVHNLEGGFGGFIFTSILEQISLNNFIPLGTVIPSFGLIFFGIWRFDKWA